jgi:hypothetical protein
LPPNREEKIKRKRRKAIEIERSYKCSVGTCHKVPSQPLLSLFRLFICLIQVYGSENALKMHIKLKHPDFVNLVPVVMVNSHLSQDYHSHHPPHHSHSHSHSHPPPSPAHHISHHPGSSSFPSYRQYPAITPAIPAQSPPTPPSQSHLRSSAYGQSPRHSPYAPFPQSPQCIFSLRLSPLLFPSH